MSMWNLNESIKVACLQNLANQSMLNGTLVIKIILVKTRKYFVVWINRGTFI